MVDEKSKDGNSTVRLETLTNAHDMYDMVNENFIRIVNEMTKFQPQYFQSISNLQIDYIQIPKNMIQNTIAAQKLLTDRRWSGFPLQIRYMEQFSKQLSEFTNHIINALDAARENLNICNRTTDTMAEFNYSMAEALNSFFNTHHQLFFDR